MKDDGGHVRASSMPNKMVDMRGRQAGSARQWRMAPWALPWIGGAGGRVQRAAGTRLGGAQQLGLKGHGVAVLGQARVQ